MVNKCIKYINKPLDAANVILFSLMIIISIKSKIYRHYYYFSAIIYALSTIF